MKQPERKNCVIYARVSTKVQAEEGYSLDQQMKACEEYAHKQGWSIGERFREEGESAKTGKRTKLALVLEYCRQKTNKVDVLLVWRVDRFFRNVEEHYIFKGKLKQLKVVLRSVTEPIDDSIYGKFMEGIFALLAELENGMKSERTIVNMIEKAKKGEWPWGAPLGYLKGFVVDADKAPLIKKLFETYGNSNGTYLVRDLVPLTKQWGLKSKNGLDLEHMAVGRILKNPLYKGWLYKEEWEIECKGTHTPLVDEALFAKVQQLLLAQGHKLQKKPKNDEVYPLKSLLRCCFEGCGSTMRSHPAYNKIGKLYDYYSCKKGKVSEGHIKVSTTKAHQAFIQLLSTITFPAERLQLFKAMVVIEYNEQMSSVNSLMAKLDRELDSLRITKSNMIREMYSKQDSSISQDDLEGELKKIKDDITDREVERGELKYSELELDEAIEECVEFFNNPAKLWQLAPYPHKVALQSILFPEGIYTDKQGNLRTPRFGEVVDGIKQFDDCKKHEVLPL